MSRFRARNVLRCGIGLVAAVTLVTACGQPGQAHDKHVKRVIATIESPSPGPARIVPASLEIPKIGVNATVEQVTVTSQNAMGVPKKPMDVGWYSPGVAPGQNGDAVIDGHLDWYGVPKAVFYNLGQLTDGDEIDVVTQNGTKLRFQVTSESSVSSSSQPQGLFSTTGSPRLTLITCAGTWDSKSSQYTQRLLVNASYIGSAT
jgi:LPXTG-site transpeptidase (sortase) family protein